MNSTRTSSISTELTASAGDASGSRKPSRFRRAAVVAAAIGGGSLLAIAAPLAASAHVGVEPSSGAAGSTSVLAFSVGHGCDGSPTTSLTFTIPEAINSVTPAVNANWDIKKVMVPLAKPITDAHGNQLAERVGQVVYTAKTPLADGFRDTVAFQVQLPVDAANTSLAFPVTQACEVGETVWDQVAKKGQDPESLESPAPAVAVGAAVTESGHGDGDGDGDGDAAAGHDEAAASDGGSTDVLGRVLGIAGLAVGAVGIVLAVSARRGRPAGAGSGAGSSNAGSNDSSKTEGK
ncbi:YcnI family protein [Plantibacter sp. YIM 135347]|uniref:YcnI family copper-binding membrane protein n=1 Tax=Plantibacter sp. YIM 135347 TaxID=3423919 RepID=UPI003D34C541